MYKKIKSISSHTSNKSGFTYLLWLQQQSNSGTIYSTNKAASAASNNRLSDLARNNQLIHPIRYGELNLDEAYE